jgi:hypothetical protein
LTVRDIPLGNLKTLLPSPFNQWIYQGRGGLELDVQGAFGALEVKGVVHSDPLQIRSGSINVANLAVVAPFEWIKPALRIKDAKLNATKLEYGATERWQGTTERINANASFKFTPNEPLKITGEFAAAGGKFSSPDGSKVGENLSLNGLFEVTSHPSEPSTNISGKFRADTGELRSKFLAISRRRHRCLSLTPITARQRSS